MSITALEKSSFWMHQVVLDNVCDKIDSGINSIKNDRAFAIASSRIAATLLPGGRTANSVLKLPLNLHSTETPTCNISKSSGMGKV